MYGKCARNITHVPDMCLVETCQANGSCPFNVPHMFPPVSRGPCHQCQEERPRDRCRGCTLAIGVLVMSTTHVVQVPLEQVLEVPLCLVLG